MKKDAQIRNCVRANDKEPRNGLLGRRGGDALLNRCSSYSITTFSKDRGDTEPFEMCPLKLHLNSKVILIPRYVPPSPSLALTHRRRLVEPKLAEEEMQLTSPFPPSVAP